MAGTVEFVIGVDASCSDGVCGAVSRVVVDPLARTVTHLVVEPKHREGLGKLVPLGLVDAATDRVRLRCTLAEFDKLDAAEETQFLPGTDGVDGYDDGQVLAWPYYRLGPGVVLGVGNVSLPVTVDTLPLGEVAVRRGERVHASDGEIGRVQGVVVEVENRHVTHVLIQEGHVFGRKEVAIPIGAVVTTAGGIQVKMTMQEIRDLPAVDAAFPTS